jgi:hypothetical protein
MVACVTISGGGGSADIVLPGAVGAPEFMAAYQAAMGSPPKPPNPHAAGTLAKLVADYYRSAEFVNLKPASQRLYKLCLDPIAKRDGHRLVREMPRDKVRKIVEEIAATHRGMANVTAKVLRRLLSYAVDNNWRPDNPATWLKQYRGGTRHSWTDADCAAFEARWPLGSRERLAYALLLYLGQRVGDTVRMRRQDMRDGCISVGALSWWCLAASFSFSRHDQWIEQNRPVRRGLFFCEDGSLRS